MQCSASSLWFNPRLGEKDWRSRETRSPQSRNTAELRRKLDVIAEAKHFGSSSEAPLLYWKVRVSPSFYQTRGELISEAINPSWHFRPLGRSLAVHHRCVQQREYVSEPDRSSRPRRRQRHGVGIRDGHDESRGRRIQPVTDSDVVVVGGGPAGSACAAELSGSGHAVTLVDDGRRSSALRCR